jgi:hypothetical protein
MKGIILFGVLSLLSFSAQADQYVRGYTRHDGTYVAPHHRSTPNHNQYDNYSSQGNSNPYTGQQGHQRNEYSAPQYVQPQIQPPAHHNFNPYR